MVAFVAGEEGGSPLWRAGARCFLSCAVSCPDVEHCWIG